MFTSDNLNHILSLRFLSEVANEKLAGEDLANRAKAEFGKPTLNWHRAFHDGKLNDFERRGFAALMELHRPMFVEKIRQNKAA